MAEKKERPVPVFSPAGIAKWVKINRIVREIKTREGIKPVKPHYAITLVLDPNLQTTTDFLKYLEAENEKGFGEAKAAAPKAQLVKMPMKIEDEEDKEGTPTGMKQITFKCVGEGLRKDKTMWTFAPQLFDAKRQKISRDVLVYGGSKVKVSFVPKHTAMPTGFFYTSFELQAVQVLVLKSQSDKDAAYYGFKDEPEYFEEGEPSNVITDGGTQAEGAAGTPTSGADF